MWALQPHHGPSYVSGSFVLSRISGLQFRALFCGGQCGTKAATGALPEEYSVLLLSLPFLSPHQILENHPGLHMFQQVRKHVAEKESSPVQKKQPPVHSHF